MKSLSELRSEQRAEVQHYRDVAVRVVRKLLQPHAGVIGVLLAGSVARGDARKGPFGLYIDLVVVTEQQEDIDLVELLGQSIEPHIPKHCINVDDTGIAIELTTRRHLETIRSRRESEIYAMQESIILYDKTAFLKHWRSKEFTITDDQQKERALQWFSRCQYLVGDYRVEKWKHRLAWVQMCQIGNEAADCYCSFLYCINGTFIPRRDWLAYLTYDLTEKAPDHERLLEAIYTSMPSQDDVVDRFVHLSEALSWMRAYCQERNWIK